MYYNGTRLSTDDYNTVQAYEGGYFSREKFDSYSKVVWFFHLYNLVESPPPLYAEWYLDPEIGEVFYVSPVFEDLCRKNGFICIRKKRITVRPKYDEIFEVSQEAFMNFLLLWFRPSEDYVPDNGNLAKDFKEALTFIKDNGVFGVNLYATVYNYYSMPDCSPTIIVRRSGKPFTTDEPIYILATFTVRPTGVYVTDPDGVPIRRISKKRLYKEIETLSENFKMRYGMECK